MKLFSKITSGFLFLTLLLNTLIGNAQNLGFEVTPGTAPPSGWISSGGTWTVTTDPNEVRTGSRAMININPSTFGSTIRTENTILTTTSPQYLITIGWGKSNTLSNAVLRLGYSNSGSSDFLNPSSTSGGQTSNLTNSGWTRITSVSANTVLPGSYRAALRAFRSVATNTDIYIDDVIFYASSSNIPDLSAPNPVSNLTLSNNTISWNNGTDNGAPASGIKGVLILKTNGLYQTPPILNNQAMYNPISGEFGSSVIVSGGISWEVVSNINNLTTTSFTNINQPSTPVTYAVYMFDLAHNYSIGTSISNVCGNYMVTSQSVASPTSVCFGSNLNLGLNGNYSFGQTFLWQSATTVNGTYSSISAESNISNLSINPLSTAYYRCKLTCPEGTVVYSSPVLVTVAPATLSGAYTIGSGGDFQTLSSAVSALNCGISGPVVFNILPNSGPFNEPIMLGSSIGSSAINTITFNFNNNQIIAERNSSSMGIVTLNGADYVTFNDMKITSIGTLASVGVLFGHESNNITLNRCTISEGSSMNLEACIASSGSLLNLFVTGSINNNNISIINCDLYGGGRSIRFLGQNITSYSTGLIVQNCNLKDFKVGGISVSYMNDCVISNNNIVADIYPLFSAYGIIFSSGGSNNLIEKNKIHNLNSETTSKGIVFSNCDAPLGSENKIINNIIYNLNQTGNIVSIENIGSNGFHVFHNTIAEKDLNNLSSGTFRGFYQSTQADNIILKNNIISYHSSKASSAYLFYFDPSNSTIISNNNALYKDSKSNRFIGQISFSDKTSLYSWQLSTGNDLQSIFTNPLFLDYENGLLKPNNSLINNIGTFQGVSNDILNSIRNSITPDPGAIEFDTVLTGLNDLEIYSVHLSSKNCPTLNDTLVIKIENNSLNSVDLSLYPLTINWAVNGPVNSNGSTTISSGILSPYSTQDYVVTANINTSEKGIYEASANIFSSWDMYNFNDTSEIVTKIIHGFDAHFSSTNILQGQNAHLNINTKNLNSFKFTEITFSPTGTGNNSSSLPNYAGTWPNNKIELSNLSNDTINIGGYQINFLGDVRGTFTFPLNTLVPPKKTVIIGLGAGLDQPSSLIFRFNFGTGSNWINSSDKQALILTHQGYILDAIAINGYSFLIENGVNSSDWSGSINIPINAAGMGLYISDNNSSSNWVSSIQAPQSIGYLNAGLSLTNSPTTWSGPNGFSGIGDSLSTGALNNLGTHIYTATVNSASCIYTDTAIVNVTAANPDVASLGLTNSNSNNCYSSSEQISVQIKNTSLLRSLDFAIDTLTLSVEISGAIDTVLTTIIYNNNLNGGLALAADSVLSIPIGFIDMSNIGTYYFKTWSEMNGDVNLQNDTSQITSITIEPVFIFAERDSICAGDTVHLSISGYNNAVNWEANAGNGWTSIGLATMISVSPNTNTQYRAVYCTNCITDTVNIQVVSANPPSIASLQQSSLTQCEGLNANFNVIANGTDLTYQWFKNNNAMQGAVNATLQLNNLLLSDSGIYFVSVTGACGSIASNNFTFNVNPKTTITSEPLSLNICENTNANFSVVANGTGSLTYQWFKNGNIINGATDSILALNTVTANDTANYTVAINGTCGNILSDSANLSLKESTIILTQPSSIAKCLGNQGVFSVILNNSNNVSYQWKKNGLNIIGANASFILINNISAADTGNYSVDVSGVCGITSSSNASLTINSPASLSIINHPQSASQCTGTNVNLSVTASGSAPLSYQWKKDGYSIPGANNSTLNLNNINSTNNGNYSVEVTSTCATLLSNNATVSVQTAPIITGQPMDNSICQGGNVSLSVSASGLSPISYQWKKGNNTIANATQATYTLNNFSTNDASVYSVEASNTCGTTISNNAILTLSQQTFITSQPSSTNVCLGTSTTLNVSAIGGGTLTYQWRKSGVNINGATTSSLNFNNAALSDVALYSVVVTGQCGIVNSNNAVLNVNALTTITTQPISTATICEGTNASINVVAAGTAPFSYQWKKDGINITGANSAALTLNNITASDSGNYTVSISGACGIVTSNNAFRNFNSIPTIISQPEPVLSCDGVTAEFSVEATGSNLAYQWRRNGSNISPIGATIYLTNISSSNHGNYSVVVSNTCGTVTSSNAALSANANPLAAGTYTIGTGGDFKNISKAINAISCGISGPVVFNVLPNTEPFTTNIQIPNIPGTSSINTITFNNLNIAGATARLTLSAQFLRFNNLILKQTTSYFSASSLSLNASSNNIFNNCEIDGLFLIFNSNTSAILINSSSVNNIFNNCTVKGGDIGIQIASSTLNVESIIQNCKIENFVEYGIYGVSLKNTIIKNNDISRPTLNQDDDFFGITLGGQSNNNLIEGNKIHDCNSTSNSSFNNSYGIYFNAVSAPVGLENKIINNTIYKLNNRSDVYGISFLNSSGAHVYHNTIAIIEPNTPAAPSKFYGFNSGTGSNLIFRNNIIYHNRNTSGASYNLYYGSNTSGVISNNNVFYNGGKPNEHIGYFGSNRTSLTNWQAANNSNFFDLLSFFDDPEFFDYDRGILIPTNNSFGNIGASLGVMTDAVGISRSAFPDPGAHEFNLSKDISLIDLTIPENLCSNTFDSLLITISNSGEQLLDFSINPFTINANISGPINLNTSLLVNSGILFPGSSQTYIINNLNLSLKGIYEANASLTALWDMQPLNSSPKTINKIVHGIDAAANPSNISVGQNSNLSLLNGGLNAVKITEITFNPSGIGNNSYSHPTNPSYWQDERLEISNISNETIDIGGYQIEFSGSVNRIFTFPPNILLPPYQSSIIVINNGANNPNSLIFQYGGAENIWSTSTQHGIILSNKGQILDVLAVNGYTFPSSSGVNASHWSGTINNIPSADAGIGRTGFDTNTGNDWVPSSITPQTIGFLNPGLILSNNPVTWTGLNNFSGVGSPLSTGPITTQGQHIYTASVTVGNCTYTDTAIVNILSNMPEIATEGLMNPSLSSDCYSSAEPIVVKVRSTSQSYSIDFSVDTLNVYVQVTGEIDTLLTTTISNNLLNGGVSLAVNDTLNIPVGNLNMGNAGVYNFKSWVKINGDLVPQNDTSSLQSITVLPVTIAASGDTICPGDSINLTFSGYNGSMTWEANSGSGWNTVDSSYAISVGPSTSTLYRAKYCNNNFTNTISVTVSTSVLPIVDNIQLSSITQCEGSSASFSVNASGNSLSYQWKKNGLDIPGAVSSILNLTNLTLGDSAIYSVAVTSACGTSTSNDVSLTVNPLTYIITQPLSTAQCEGTNVSFTVAAAGAGTLTYQWKKGSNNIIGANAANLNLNNINAADAANYSVDVTGACGTISSNMAALNVNPATTLNSLSNDTSLCTGENLTLSAQASGTGILSYQWKKDNINISGANSSSYLISNAQILNTGNYSVEVNSDCGTILSNPISVSIFDGTIITSQPSNLVECVGANVSFSVAGAGGGILSYQWKKGANDIIGANSTTLNLSTISASDAGNYSVIVTSGCGSATSDTVSLTLNPIYNQTASATICQGDVYAFGMQNLTTTGTYTEVFNTINGCDSTVVLTLNVNPSFNQTASTTICQGDVYSFGMQNLTTAGTYTEVFNTINGCDSTVVLTLNVNPVFNQTASASFCPGDTYIFGTQNLTTAGTYTEVFNTINGCDSTVVLTLNVSPTFNQTASATICQDDVYAFGMQNLTTAGTYTEVFNTINGCDSTVVLTLSVNPSFIQTASATICQGDVYTFGTQNLSSAGTYTEVFNTINGCDSTVVLTLSVNPSFNQTASATICQGDVYTFGTQNLSTAGTYTEIFNGVTGCDSTVVLTLSVNPIFNQTASATICQGDVFAFGAQNLSTAGTYTEVFNTVNGCDSTVVLTLSVNPSFNQTASATICQGDVFAFGAQNLTTAGTYTEVFNTVNGCDSTVVLTLSVNPIFNQTASATICQGDVYTFGTQNLSTAGTYTEVFNTINGCDSTVVLTLSVNPSFNQTASATICQGDVFAFGAQNLSTAGTYTEVFNTVNGCDSTVVLTLSVNPSFNQTASATICQGDVYAFGTQNLSTAGTYTEVFNTINGCDSTVVLTLSVNPVFTQSISAQICFGDVYNFGNLNLTANGVYTLTFQSASGCDSIVTLNLSVKPTYNQNKFQQICQGESFVFGSQVLTNSGNYTEVFSSIFGCDSTVFLTLNVININTSITDSSFVLKAIQQNNATYQWIDCNNNNTPIAGETNNVFSPSADGSYAVIINLNNCSDTSNCFTILGIGIAEKELLKFNIYPNPARNQFTIENAEIGSNVQINDLFGKTIFVGKINDVKTTIEADRFNNGVYSIMIENNGKIGIQKLIISK